MVGHDPKVCVGYKQIGERISWNLSDLKFCPKNYAVFASEPNAANSRYAKANEVRIQSYCCPLPADDILLDQHVLADTECPESYIVTSSTGGEDKVDSSAPPRYSDLGVFRCTKINTKRYKLGKELPAVAWGRGTSSYKEKSLLLIGDIPLAIRGGVRRQSKYRQAWRGCIGQPFGSLLTGKMGGKRCSAHLYRELQFAGAENDPKEGSAVKMFPNCNISPDPYRPEDGCVEVQE